MTKWVIAAVALALVAFIFLDDLFGNSPTAIFGGQDNVVGYIAGDRITIDEFNAAVQERENNYIMSFNRQPGERERETLRQQAWTLLIARHAITPEYKKVGVEVTQEEVWDMIQGKNLNESIKASFLDSAGNFDRNQLMAYLKRVSQEPVTSPDRVRWELFKADLAPARERIKYENLLIKTNYVTAAEAERQYHLDNDVAEIKFLYVPYSAVTDSTAVPSDADLKKYYEANKSKYKTAETRSINYVRFPIVPSSKDTVATRTEMERVAVEFRNTADDSTFASINTAPGAEGIAKYDINTLPTYINRLTMTEGLVLGPFLDNGSYKIVKVVDIGKDTVYNMRASHILIKWDNETPEAKKAAMDKAKKVLAEIKAGASFASKALEYGTDGTRTQGGDLGWFKTGAMVAPFEKAVANAKKVGLLNEIVETQFGYHLIDVTGVKNNDSYIIATIERPLTISDGTQDSVYRKADMFATDLSGVNEFKERAKTEQLSVYNADDLGGDDRFIGNIGEARQVVSWLFREASVGKVSTIFSLDNQYVVAVMTGITEEGFKPYDKVKPEITPAVTREVQAKSIIAKLSGEGSLEDLAKLYPNGASVSTASDVKLNSSNIQTIGFDPVAIGKSFAVENGKRSKPFAGENGVVVIEAQNKTIAPGVPDYSMFKTQLKQNLDNRSGLDIAEALKDKAGIEDKRYKFF